MAAKSLADNLGPVNPGTAGNTRTGKAAGSRTPERDVADKGKRKPQTGKGVVRKASSASSVRNQALVNIGTARRIGRMGGSAVPMPAGSAHASKNLPAHNMSGGRRY